MQVSKIYKIGPVRTLIDLNADMHYFKSTFKVTSSPSNTTHTFSLLVLSQEKLDDSDSESNPLEYKTVDKYISGSIQVDSGNQQNYYLLLKSDVPMECLVDIETVAIDSSDEIEVDSAEKPPALDNPDNHYPKEFMSGNPMSPFKSIAKLVVIGLIAACILGGVYFLLTKKSDDTVKTKPLFSLLPDQTNGLNMDLLKKLDSIHS